MSSLKCYMLHISQFILVKDVLTSSSSSVYGRLALYLWNLKHWHHIKIINLFFTLSAVSVVYCSLKMLTKIGPGFPNTKKRGLLAHMIEMALLIKLNFWVGRVCKQHLKSFFATRYCNVYVRISIFNICYSRNHKKHINAVCRSNTEVMNVTYVDDCRP
jgi:hypothetical protein